ncbi:MULTISPECIES: GYF domain-containing protein [Stenotrophomonas]|uniref:GYF domain-containing protein n=1 Tax=Stenotrophomonas TaxID=40323 RepID=UPI000D53C9F0|nr:MULTISPECIES: GYF domain-containing protein [Stenotrophomonas]AWH30644.1 fimbrial protein [Stenotrophomonas sp. YAU14A_MKIMI4_1]AWH34591.1 fimbrial protein [Stenotrophomonas sp. SAU14A_NAIMI4_8]
MSEWFHAEGNRQQGPLPAEQLIALFRSNQINLDTLVWRDGLPQWQPLRSVVDELGLIVPAMDAPASVEPPPPPAPPAPPEVPLPPTLPPATPYAAAPAMAAPPPKKGLSGCAITAIIGGGLLLILVPICAILAAIALPAYNDYTIKAKVAGAITALQPLKDQVQHFADDEGRCPGANDAGFPGAGDFAAQGLSAVHIGRFNNGHCGIEATLSVPGKTIDGDLLWQEYDRDSGRWECSGESDDKYLPVACRG